jgi:hypothetical protein
MAQVKQMLVMTSMTVRMVVATVNSTGQMESTILMEHASKDHAATVAEALPKEGVVVVQMHLLLPY